MELDLGLHPHRRFNPLLREWILVSPHRARRPWSGQIEEAAPEGRSAYDPGCYLCPGNARAGGAKNPRFAATFVFDNDFAALVPGAPDAETQLRGESLLRLQAEPGVCRVVVFSPRHDLTLAGMPRADVIRVVELWSAQYAELGERPEINHVLIFENKGAMMGCSNPHPHSQIWASHRIPTLVERELAAQRDHLEETGRCLLCEYTALEERLGERVVFANAHFLALVPFWATWPYELLLVPRRHLTGLPELDSAERSALAEALSHCAGLLDRLFRTDCPYSSGIHQRPTDGLDHPGLHLHLHYFPPLLRSATIKKFLVGYEMAAEPQRDLTPEEAAERLRSGRL